MPSLNNLLLILLLPFCSFLLLGLAGRKRLSSLAGILGTTSLFISALLSVHSAWTYFSSTSSYTPEIAWSMNWLQFSESLSIDMGVLVDPISMMMLVVVTVVSFMVHLYSLGYMKGDERFTTYYAYLSLFTFSMLGLVVSVNLFQMYMFWELVGVSSFLLIGFYYDKPSAVSASKKAFIVTRFADLGFLIGILILGHGAETLDFNTLVARLTDSSSPWLGALSASSFLGASALTWGLLLVFMGGAGKSAMFPLHIWLPDAMEGPTPVSALIHAATMVVAGVYLVARLFPVFAIACPVALDVVLWTGIISSVFAALIACAQTDIKRVLAYSTMSQIGYMMFALGLSGYGGEAGLGYTASLFHLFTHAFFKALLFLGAGAVIHMVHSNEIKDMGGLRKRMPVTHLAFLIGCLAISGIPPFAGFFSKEEILTAAYAVNPVIYWIALITAGFTAFYMFRLYYLIFWSSDAEASDAHHGDGHHGEGTFSMKLPLLLLSAGALVAGFVPFGNYVSSDGSPLHIDFHITAAILPVLIALTGIGIATYFYKTQSSKPAQLMQSMKVLYMTLYHKFFIDEIYLFITKHIIFPLIGRPAAWIDKFVIDGTVIAIGRTTDRIAETVRVLQTGRVQDYALFFIASFITLALFAIYFFH
ncbi:MAG: NADH-quinone oxidoreductase subunit L [Bacteroidota bacterium]